MTVGPLSHQKKEASCNLSFARLSGILDNLVMTHHQDIQDINANKSEKKGLVGSVETLLRKFRQAAFLFALVPIILAYVIALGTSLSPGLYLYWTVEERLSAFPLLVKAPILGSTIAAGFILFIFTIIVIVPVLNLPARFFINPYRGPWFSLESIPWFYHNALTYLVRYTVLDFITPTPLNIFFFRAMGMKVGKGCMINTSNISDPALIILGDYVTIGGSAYLMAHYGMKGYLIIDHLKIGAGTTVGLNAKILGGVDIGRRVAIAPNHTVFPKTKLADGTKVGMPDPSNPVN